MKSTVLEVKSTVLEVKAELLPATKVVPTNIKPAHQKKAKPVDSKEVDAKDKNEGDTNVNARNVVDTENAGNVDVEGMQLTTSQEFLISTSDEGEASTDGLNASISDSQEDSQGGISGGLGIFSSDDIERSDRGMYFPSDNTYLAQNQVSNTSIGATKNAGASSGSGVSTILAAGAGLGLLALLAKGGGTTTTSTITPTNPTTPTPAPTPGTGTPTPGTPTPATLPAPPFVGDNNGDVPLDQNKPTVKLQGFEDRGLDKRDGRSNDPEFTLSLVDAAGVAVSGAVQYERSFNGGAWADTTATQRVADGSYRFRAKGRESNETVITIDTVAPPLPIVTLWRDTTNELREAFWTDKVSNSSTIQVIGFQIEQQLELRVDFRGKTSSGKDQTISKVTIAPNSFNLVSGENYITSNLEPGDIYVPGSPINDTQLVDGPITASVTLMDLYGNTRSLAPFTFTLDTVNNDVLDLTSLTPHSLETLLGDGYTWRWQGRALTAAELANPGLILTSTPKSIWFDGGNGVIPLESFGRHYGIAYQSRDPAGNFSKTVWELFTNNDIVTSPIPSSRPLNPYIPISPTAQALLNNGGVSVNEFLPTVSIADCTGIVASGETSDTAFTLDLPNPIISGTVTVFFERSTDEGVNWAPTSAQQNGLSVGSYRFRAIIMSDDERVGLVTSNVTVVKVVAPVASPLTLGNEGANEGANGVVNDIIIHDSTIVTKEEVAPAVSGLTLGNDLMNGVSGVGDDMLTDHSTSYPSGLGGNDLMAYQSRDQAVNLSALVRDNFAVIP